MRNIWVFPILIFVSSCKGPSSGEHNSAAMDLVMPPPSAEKSTQVQDGTAQEASQIEKKVIKEGDISFKTTDIPATRKALYETLKKLGGYVADESEENNGGGDKIITIEARIPAKNFDIFLTNVSANAESIDSKNIRIKDVTTQFIDVTTQLTNKKKLEQRYLELLNKSSKVSDLLEIENKLAEIRSSIESTQGQLNYLARQVEYSSLTISFYSKQTANDNGQSFSYKIKNALVNGWYILGSLFFGFIEWWPVWLVLFAMLYLYRKWRKNGKIN